MKRLTWVVAVAVLGSVMLAGCGKYKSFEEETSALNADYMKMVVATFKQNKTERNAALQQFQQDYDKTFAEVAKRWKEDANTSKVHLNFQKVYCKQTIQDPYQEKVDEIVNKYTAEFGDAFKTLNKEKMNAFAVKAGTELGTLSALYEQKAKANDCSLAETNASDLMGMLVTKI